MDFNRLLNIPMQHFTKSVPLINSFGPMFPALQDDILAELLEIKPEERVLDIGGGAHPFRRADTVTEPFLHQSSHRSGQSVVDHVRYVECFAEQLPFDDQSFDFAIARQVFEHVNSPGDACKEMMRVSRRGFIETPQKNFELLLGPNPSHNWFVTLQDGVLLFERRMFIRHPFRHISFSAVPSSSEGQLLQHLEFKNVTNVQFYWEHQIRYDVIDSEDGFDYRNQEHAAQTHLDTALCSLLHRGIFLEAREHDAREAVRLKPGWALARNTLGILLWKQRKRVQAIEQFETANALEPREEYRHNALIDPLGEVEPILVDFEDTLEMDERFYERFSRKGCFQIADYLYGPHVK
ncbi:methyltransferase domain-containing protein [Paenibacillus sp. NPDC056579]|uniref:class I SAM-dependent methyltransferase n=1 Tax=Paenibacillus sp. NPDC056579 TaxID=3345871 RepID=UPI0036A992AB